MSKKTSKSNLKTMITKPCDDLTKSKADFYLKMCKDNSIKFLKKQFKENTNEPTENGTCFT